MKNLIKAGVMGALAMGMVAVSQPAQAAHHMGHGHHCSKMMVSGSMAYLQHMPSLNSKRYGAVKKGTHLWNVMNTNGTSVHQNGWYLVKTANGHRYWVHKSVVSCAAHAKHKHMHKDHNHKHHAHKHHKNHSHMAHAKNPHKNGCSTVKVNSKWAQGKAMASMGSRTLRNIPWGEKLMVQNNMGSYAHPHMGYWLVKSMSGHRYWVHQSQLACSTK